MKKIYLFLIAMLYSFFVNAQTWEQLNDIPTESLIYARVEVVNNTAYLLDEYERNLLEYDESNDTWNIIEISWMTTPRQHVLFYAIDDELFVGGGFVQGESGILTRVNDFYKYVPSTNTWTQLQDINIEYPDSFSLMTGDGGVFLRAYNDIHSYDATTDTWSHVTDYPGAEFTHTCGFHIDGNLYMGFGVDVMANAYTYFYKYDVANNIWNQLQDADFENPISTPTTFTDGTFGYTVHGYEDAATTDKFYRYNPIDDSWLRLTDTPYTAEESIAFIVNDYAYVGLGYDFPDFYNSLYRMPLESLSVGEIDINDWELYFSSTENSLKYQNIPLGTEIRIYSSSGQLVKNTEVDDNPIDVTSLSKGAYIVLIQDESKVASKKIILY